jgi:hypothetical protein
VREVGQLVFVVVAPVADLFGGERGEQHVGAQVRIRGTGLGEQDSAMQPPEPVRARA